MKKNQLPNILFISGNLFVLAGSIVKLINQTFAPYIFSVGAALIIFVQLNHAIENRNSETRQKRLSRNGILSALLLGLAAYFMFTGSNSWVVAVLIYGLSSFILSYRGDSTK